MYEGGEQETGILYTNKRYPHKKTNLGESLAKSRTYNTIRDSGEMLGEREKSHQESSLGSLRDFWRDSWRDFSRSSSVSPESRVGLYAWLSARLSPRLVFFTRVRHYSVGTGT